jgi:ATP-binding cassette subfamily C protein/ATP-binding cassette subfamily C protein LapB
LLIGAVLVMRAELSVGALIAIMMLIWRILAPIQTVFTNLNRISQFLESVKQINLLMRIPVEREAGTEAPVARKFRGRVTFSGVAFRYGAQDEPVFRGLNLDIPEGQFVCISSATAGGKSTILKLILGLYKPQAGGIFLDGLNLQQLDPHEVRASIGYLPLEPTFFYGTVAQNLRLAAPTATDGEIHQALVDAGVDITASMFPDGIETRLSSERLAQIPPGTQQALSIARVYCKRSAIFLLNDPDARLDDTGSQALIAKLSKLKGKSTIILISSKREHMMMCDRILKLNNGVIVEDSTPAEHQHD